MEAGSAKTKGTCDSSFKDKALLERIEKPRDGQRAPDGAWAWVVCISGVLSSIIVFGFCYSFGLLFPLLLDEFKESKAKTAWVASLGISVSGILAPFVGKLCKCLGPRLLMVFGTLLCIAGLLATTQVSSISWMYLTYGGLFGLGSCAVFMATFIEVPKHFIKRRSLATGMIAMGPGGGLLILSPIVQALLDVLHWRHTLMAIAGIVSLCGFLGCTYSKRLSDNSCTDQSPRIEKDFENTAKERLKRLSFLKNPLYLSFTMINTVALFGHIIPTVHLIRYAQDLGITAHLASRLYLCSGLGSLLARLVTGRMGDFNWFNPRILNHLGFALGGVSTLLLPKITSYSLLLLYSFAYGVSDGLICCSGILSIMSFLRETEVPIGFGLSQLAVCLAFAGGPPLGGLIADVYGYYTPAFYVAGGIEMLATMTLFFTYLLKPTLKKSTDVASTADSYELFAVTEKVTVL